MLGLGSKLTNLPNRPVNKKQGIVFDGTEDAVYTSNSDDEFSNWEDFTIAVWLIPTYKFDVIPSGLQSVISLGIHSHKGFDLFSFAGDLYLSVGDATDSTTATTNISLSGYTSVGGNPGSAILVVARGDLSEEKISLSGYHFSAEQAETSDATWNGHWDDPGTNVHLTIGGKDGTASGIAITKDWGGNSRVAQVGMWKEHLSDANLETIWESKNTPFDSLGIGTMRHHWVFDLGQTSYADRIATASKTMLVLNDSIVRTW